MSILDKPKTKRRSLHDLIPVAVVRPGDGIDYAWIRDLINDLRADAGLTPLTHEK
ncbi:hypothetical protein [Corynebacterium wankanglinii]|uniref:Uncharacterized protein n=1 Tax=Corynebacterium wankanglinii TaxID=2735136 RepID=A0A838CL63_9CORY|nr:hypothetical protein [Corynebacterium wankanglinii]MBA1836286.1 hypothetical protein [Corynebacterium wankanglinii]